MHQSLNPFAKAVALKKTYFMRKTMILALQHSLVVTGTLERVGTKSGAMVEAFVGLGDAVKVNSMEDA